MISYYTNQDVEYIYNLCAGKDADYVVGMCVMLNAPAEICRRCLEMSTEPGKYTCKYRNFYTANGRKLSNTEINRCCKARY